MEKISIRYKEFVNNDIVEIETLSARTIKEILKTLSIWVDSHPKYVIEELNWERKPLQKQLDNNKKELIENLLQIKSLM